MLRTSSQKISGWGNNPRQSCLLVRPEKLRDLYPDFLSFSTSCIARGAGKSYGDASLNQDALVVLTQRLNRFIHFDKAQGILSAEAGVTLEEILSVIVPQGWFLPVTPGTKKLTLGGCVASDVHGKNHHKCGSFGNYIISFEILTGNNLKLLCSPQENTDLFWATIGGMGLTGFISNITFKLIPIKSATLSVKHYTANDLSSTFQYLTEKIYDDDYSVAWIDTQKKRSIVMCAHHANPDEIDEIKDKNSLSLLSNPKDDSFSMPFCLPSGFLNNTLINGFNTLYFKAQSEKSHFLAPIDRYFYPLDKIHDWNKLYGKYGFVQFQCAIPESVAFEGIESILSALSKKHASFLSVLKRFGPASKGLLSFPIKGFTLALDLPFKGMSTITLLKQLEKITLEYQGRIYLAKDAFLSAEGFKAMNPNLDKFLKIKQQYDPKNIFQSSLSRRLKIFS